MDARGKPVLIVAAVILTLTSVGLAGPYSAGMADPDNAYDPPIPGWVGPAGDGYVHNPGLGFYAEGNTVNPAFVAWADAVVSYEPAPQVDPYWADPAYALGPATGFREDIVSLGELSAAEIAAHLADPTNPSIEHPGSITLSFSLPIYDGAGPDLAVFENSFFQGPLVFAELAYVEVSSNGSDFARFPSRSLTADPVGPYNSLDATDVYNLAGKHVNMGGISWGTPFDLAELAADPQVTTGAVALNAIRYVRLIDIPGSGDFLDSEGDGIYDPWDTYGSAGFDLDAVGALHAGLIPGDCDGDGDVDLTDLALLAANWNATGASWDDGDFDADGDVDLTDLAILAGNWNQGAMAVPAGVPEPTSAACIIGSMALLGSRRRTR